ncbi:MAG: DNA-binding protein [Actinobacteria bacterium]|nr:DNA-binding protein [Actinomycetota bacterium]
MTKAQLIAEIAEAAGITIKDAKKIFNITLDIIIREIISGNEVKFPGFGKFYRKTIPARKGVCAIGNIPYESSEKKKYAFKGSTI